MKSRPMAKNGALANIKPRPVGRPTKFKPEFCDVVMEHLTNPNKLGTLRGLAARLNISPETLYRWKRDIPEFSNALQNAQAIQEEKLAQAMLLSNLNTTGCIFTLKNLYNWKDKREVQANVSIADALIDHDNTGTRKRVRWDEEDVIDAEVVSEPTE
tara:strand:- start:563 stop:1033 length:471 start_codon:yes stop_codon:yes gene_type:complete